MTPEALDKVLGILVPQDSYRSPRVPTTRLGPPALITVFGPRKGSAATHTEAPYQWLATDPRSGGVLAFAKTSTVSPYGGFEAAPVTPFSGQLDPRSAYGVLRANWEAVVMDGFFGGGTVSADVAASIAAAYESTVPPRYLPWLIGCCADFFGWLNEVRDAR
jgi:hypothetical protein